MSAPDLFAAAGVAAPVGEHARQPRAKAVRCKFCRKAIPDHDEGAKAWRICDVCWDGVEFG